MISNQLEMLFQLLFAVFLGSLIGFERGYRGRAAGMRTYALVSLGAALFSIFSVNAFSNFIGNPGVRYDPSRIISQVVVGIGFLGAGLMVFRNETPFGLTTAAALWVAAAIGVAVGVKMYLVALFSTFLTIIVLYFFLRIEYFFALKKPKKEHLDESG